MEITFISDTHWIVSDPVNTQDLNDLLPGGPILVHAGDVSGRGTEREIRVFLEWFSSQPYMHKILIAGNHDFFFEVAKPEEVQALLAEYPGITYLNDSGVTIEGIKFWGSPVTPFFHNWAFNRYANEIGPHWDLIPEGIDVLITHGPPHGILDKTIREGWSVGCKSLKAKVDQIKPQVHVFGHIHEGMGQVEIGGTTFINASVVDERYRLWHNNPPIINVEPRSENLV
jgi:Icc-related predicted phosphoesterase